MGDRGVSDGQQENLTSSELFHRVFPEYLAMGMTYEQFWKQDCSLVIAYRKAYRIKQENANQMAWLQGLYIYRAIHGAPVAIGFAKGNATPQGYFDRPIDFAPKREKTAQERYDDEVREQSERIKLQMERFMVGFNAERRKSELKALMAEPPVAEEKEQPGKGE